MHEQPLWSCNEPCRVPAHVVEVGGACEHDWVAVWVDAWRAFASDWAYAASWDLENVRQCTPDNGYPPSRTSYTPDMLRAFNFLVETWDAKRPPAHQLGNVPSKLADLIQGQGHVPRNLRLALFFIDLVQVRRDGEGLAWGVRCMACCVGAHRWHRTCV